MGMLPTPSIARLPRIPTPAVSTCERAPLSISRARVAVRANACRNPCRMPPPRTPCVSLGGGLFVHLHVVWSTHAPSIVGPPAPRHRYCKRSGFLHFNPHRVCLGGVWTHMFITDSRAGFPHAPARALCVHAPPPSPLSACVCEEALLSIRAVHPLGVGLRMQVCV